MDALSDEFDIVDPEVVVGSEMESRRGSLHSLVDVDALEQQSGSVIDHQHLLVAVLRNLEPHLTLGGYGCDVVLPIRVISPSDRRTIQLFFYLNYIRLLKCNTTFVTTLTLAHKPDVRGTEHDVFLGEFVRSRRELQQRVIVRSIGELFVARFIAGRVTPRILNHVHGHPLSPKLIYRKIGRFYWNSQTADSFPLLC
jgi:hypothetical protein